MVKTEASENRKSESLSLFWDDFKLRFEKFEEVEKNLKNKKE